MAPKLLHFQIRQAYLAGKYTDPDPAAVRRNIAAACEAAVLVAKAGFHPIVPHSAIGHRVGWNAAMTRCSEIFETLVPGQDLVVLLPGWRESIGATLEKKWGETAGLEVIELHHLLASQIDGLSA